jgi:hypothetical protein
MVQDANEWLDLRFDCREAANGIEVTVLALANGVGSGKVQTMQLEFV